MSFQLAFPDKVYDLVVLSEEADPSVWVDYPHGKIVYDLIDSYLAIPRTNIKQWLRGPLWFITRRQKNLKFDQWRTIEDMCHRADAVVCTTEEQRKDIKPFCPNVHIVLDLHTSVVTKVKQDYRCAEPFRLVWEGLPSNITQLNQVAEVLRELDKMIPIELNIVTNPDQPRFLGRYGTIQSIDLAKKVFERVVFHHWEKDAYSKVVCDCDLAIVPIDLSDPFVTGKPENKLLLLWRMGMPVVASATPAYQRAMRGAGLGDMACSTSKEWLGVMEKMMEDESERCRAGRQGRAFAEAENGHDVLLSRWDAVFSSLGFSFSDAIQ